MPQERTAPVETLKVTAQGAIETDDVLAVEEPLEIRVAWRTGGEQREKPISVTMRTPGDDFDLAAGFLFTEALIGSGAEIEGIRQWGSPNVVRVSLIDGATIDAAKLDRHFYTTSSCGVCGKTSIDAVRVLKCGAGNPAGETGTPARLPAPHRTPIERSLVHRLPEVLSENQSAFRATGGLHGAAILRPNGELLRTREDIGRHNAVDKVIGSLLREEPESLAGAILMVSSRASFELAQKAIVAGIGVLASVGAPSTLAVDAAREFGLTLLGFVRDGRFNVYAGEVS
ncbi:MAG TPA: formate dehydrogenase accessory sulfurtransferase FdhD [Thermoanaerobaculia bacterium]|jgi:FdhD protein|nr:formate dehydrogenase accessory sulfurtransferase FdhD [Thermoanaerobaculia bacterium]